MNNIAIVAVGWLIGQSAVNCIEAWKLQKGNDQLSFPESLKIVFGKNGASHAFGIIMLVAALFMLPEFVKNVMIVDDAGKKIPGWAAKVLTWLRASSIAFGAICQYIGLLLFAKLKQSVKTFIQAKNESNGN